MVLVLLAIQLFAGIGSMKFLGAWESRGLHKSLVAFLCFVLVFFLLNLGNYMGLSQTDCNFSNMIFLVFYFIAAFTYYKKVKEKEKKKLEAAAVLEAEPVAQVALAAGGEPGSCISLRYACIYHSEDTHLLI